MTLRNFGTFRCGRKIVVFRSEAVIFSVLGLILYSVHDLIPCMESAPRTAQDPGVAGAAS
jgi:hypothetical protein